jgi:hypothetical protein
MMVRPAEEESESEVRRVDQDNINKFARLNARLHDLRDERSMIRVRRFMPRLVSLSFETLFFSNISSPL